MQYATLIVPMLAHIAANGTQIWVCAPIEHAQQIIRITNIKIYERWRNMNLKPI